MAVFIGYVIFFLILLPAWAVKTAPMESRILMWGFPIFIVGFFTAVVFGTAPKADAPAVEVNFPSS